MAYPRFKYIYGPVYSWRMGMSLGIDPLSTAKKYCNFGCSYCQLGPAESFSFERKTFVPVEEVMAEIKQLPANTPIDYFTFSGNGEPTLAENLGDMIRALRQARSEKIAVITNSTLVNDPSVRRDLSLADFILFKIDAPNQEVFRKVNGAPEDLRIEDIIKGIKDFKKSYRGRLALQMMFTPENKAFAGEMAAIARDIQPDEVQLNTPLRPCPVKPLAEGEMAGIKKVFLEAGLKTIEVYECEKREYQPFDDKATARRHGKFNRENQGHKDKTLNDK